ncbi:MAG: hypothetical protein JW763_04180 [candidate division Zixibacteria bacterium]|nr:hypothetical protein [candidate division Zixibacteria bacterium]
MPVRNQISADGTYVRTTASGNLTAEDIIASIRALAVDERVKPGFRQLFDVRAMAESRLSPEAMRRISEANAANPKKTPDSLLAIVAGTGKDYAEGRTYEAVATPTVENVIVFNNPETAEIWLGVTGMNLLPPDVDETE